MSSLYKILKANLINATGINKLLKAEPGSSRNKAILATIGMGLVVLMLAYIPFMYATVMADVLTEMGLLDLILVAAIMGSVMVTFLTSIYKAQGVLFSAKDYEMLMALPIKPSIVLTSKIMQLLTLNYLFTAVILIPTSIVYFMRVSLSAIFFIYLIMAFIFIPLLPIVVASIIAFILSYISSKVRFKNLVVALGSFIAVIGIMAVSMNMNGLTDVVTEFIAPNSEVIMDMVSKIYPPAVYFTDALVNLSIFSLLKLIATSIIPFIVFLFIFSKLYKTINSKLGESFKAANYKLTTLKTKSKMKALVTKELRGYFSCPIYILNTYFGVVLITVASVSSIFFGGDIIVQFMDVPEVGNILHLIMIGVLSLVFSISCTTNSSISLEGKKLWILKSSPIDIMDIFKGKIIMNLVILFPMILLNACLLLISLNPDLISFLWLIIIPSLYAFVISILGLLVNLHFPKLEWTTETTVVKQSLSAMIMPFVGIIIVAIPVAILVILKITNINLYLIGLSLVLILVVALLWGVLNKNGRKLFDKLSN